MSETERQWHCPIEHGQHISVCFAMSECRHDLPARVVHPQHPLTSVATTVHTARCSKERCCQDSSSYFVIGNDLISKYCRSSALRSRRAALSARSPALARARAVSSAAIFSIQARQEAGTEYFLIFISWVLEKNERCLGSAHRAHKTWPSVSFDCPGPALRRHPSCWWPSSCVPMSNNRRLWRGADRGSSFFRNQM